MIEVSRIDLRCITCPSSGFVVDDRLGIHGRYSRKAERLICLAAASWSYDVSSERLEELCGLDVSDTTIREISQEHGAQANEWVREEPAAVKQFRESTGNIEFTTDGTCVNTIECWREMKVGMFSKRDHGAPTTPEEWNSRQLPAPKTRIAFAAIEDCEQFGRRWKAWQKRLGLPDPSAIAVLADGAKWIWEQQRLHLHDAEGVLDIFHALEHLSTLGKALHDDLQSQQLWLDKARDALLRSGWDGIAAFVNNPPSSEVASEVMPRTPAQQAAIDALLDYLSPHQHHLHCADRLANGQSIGSGQIEGACKNLIGRRLKANAARWRVRRVNRMAGLCSIMYTHHWEKYWQSQ